jgi:uncharacterized protein (DUF362 family)
MTIGRREFCAGAGALVCGAALSTCQRALTTEALPDGDPPAAMSIQVHGSGKAAVVEVRWTEAVDSQGRVHAANTDRMLGAAVARLTGSSDPWSAWAGATRKIAIKVNAIGSQAHTHPEVAASAARRLVGAGADPARVTVWDRDTSGLVQHGYTVDKTGKQLGYRCLATEAVGGDKYPRSAAIAGTKIYLSKLLDDADLLLNIAALKDHSMAGVTLCLKNNFGMINGAERLHGNFHQGSGCEPGISQLAARPEIKDRLQLAVIDALVGVCQGGPGEAKPEHVFRYGGLLVSRDPVAVDRRGLAIIEARRAKLGLEPLSRRTKPNPSPCKHIDNAAALGVSPG